MFRPTFQENKTDFFFRAFFVNTSVSIMRDYMCRCRLNAPETWGRDGKMKVRWVTMWFLLRENDKLPSRMIMELSYA